MNARHDVVTRRRRHAHGDRAGVTTVELAVVLMVFLTLVLGMIDLGLAVYRHHVLGEVARCGARRAIVRGNLGQALGAWGPAGYSGSGNDTHPLPTSMRPLLAGFDLDEVTVQAEWPDGGNDPLLEHRVRVTVSMPFRPIMTFIFGNPSFTLRGTSTMTISH